MQKPLRYIIVGTGDWGCRWMLDFLPQLETQGKAVPVAAVDINPVALLAPQQHLGIPAAKCYTDINKAFIETPADFAIIIVPPTSREQVIDVALTHNMHILAEKPMADTIDAACRIYRKVQSAGKKMAVTMTHRFAQDKQSLEHLIKSGAYGRLDYIVGRNTWEYRKFPEWGGYRYRMTDPLLIEGAVHHFDMMRALAGSNAREVYAKTWTPKWSDFEGDSQALVIVEMQNGVRVFYEGALNNASTLNDWGEDYWRAECEMATLELDQKKLRIITGARGRNATIQEYQCEKQPAWGNSWLAEIFVEWLSGGPAPQCTIEDNMQCVALLFAAIESSRTGKPVDVQAFLQSHLAKLDRLQSQHDQHEYAKRSLSVGI